MQIDSNNFLSKVLSVLAFVHRQKSICKIMQSLDIRKMKVYTTSQYDWSPSRGKFGTTKTSVTSYRACQSAASK